MKQKLTKREIQVLQLSARGLTHIEAARDLGVQPETCRKHRNSIIAKLRLPNMLTCVIWAIAHGEIDIPEELQ